MTVWWCWSDGREKQTEFILEGRLKFLQKICRLVEMIWTDDQVQLTSFDNLPEKKVKDDCDRCKKKKIQNRKIH